MRSGQVAFAMFDPKPMKNRPARYIGSEFDAGGKDCSSAPMRMKRHPMAVPCRLPNPSAIYGTNGRHARPPKPGIAPKIPSLDPTG